MNATYKRCKAMTKFGTQCKRPALPTSKYCKLHVPDPSEKSWIQKLGPWIGAAGGAAKIIEILITHGGQFLNATDVAFLRTAFLSEDSEKQTAELLAWFYRQPSHMRTHFLELIEAASATPRLQRSWLGREQGRGRA